MPDEPAPAQLHSMTGFARAAGSAEGRSWVLEVKSVNGKGLDLRSRLPPGWEALELPLRQRTAARIARGNLQLFLNLDSAGPGTASSWRLNRPLMAELVALAREVEAATGVPQRLDSLLTMRGVLEQGEPVDDRSLTPGVEAAVLASLDAALGDLSAMRAVEGRALLRILSAQLGDARRLVAEATAHAGAQTHQLRERLHAALAELIQAVPPIGEDRLAQELALLGTRADVREELDRLAAHIAAFTDMLAEGGAVGRRLDFLCQELGREANTLCAKSASLALTDNGLALKALIEQLREQVQNLE